MLKKFDEPIVDIVEFSVENVLTGSIDEGPGGNANEGGSMSGGFN